jgi:hypothetical protein
MNDLLYCKITDIMMDNNCNLILITGPTKSDDADGRASAVLLYLFSIPVTALSLLGMIHTVYAVAIVFRRVTLAIDYLASYNDWLDQLVTNSTKSSAEYWNEPYNTLVGWFAVRQYFVGHHFKRLYAQVSYGISFLLIVVALVSLAIVGFVFAWHITVNNIMQYFNVIFMVFCVIAAAVVLVLVLHSAAKTGEQQYEHKRFLSNTKMSAAMYCNVKDHQSRTLDGLWNFIALCDSMIHVIDEYDIYPEINILGMRINITPAHWKALIGAMLTSATTVIGKLGATKKTS